MTARRSRARAWLAIAAAGTAAAGCHPRAPVRTAAVRRSALAAAGELIAAVELGDALYLFAADRVTIERGGAVVMTVPAPDGRWAEAVAMAALDDTGAWVVARTTAGSLWRITLTGDLAPIQDRMGLPPRARSIAAPGAAPGAVPDSASDSASRRASPSGSISGSALTAAGAGSGAASDVTLAIALDDGVAIVRDRAHVARFPAAASGSVIASRDRVALVRGDQLDVWNLADLTHAGYTVPGAFAAAFGDPSGRAGRSGDALVVATPAALYVEAAGELHRWPAPAELHALAAAGSRLWVATARGIFVVDGGGFVPTAVAAAAADHVFGLAGGDLVVAAPAGLVRLSLDRAGDDPRWDAEVLPIFERVCAKCHRPGGAARVDLSTVAAWRAERAELVHRVVETHTMPPAGTPLADAERRALTGWLSP
jgi:mono/diheme cytochrome c family protein